MPNREANANIAKEEFRVIREKTAAPPIKRTGDKMAVSGTIGNTFLSTKSNIKSLKLWEGNFGIAGVCVVCGVDAILNNGLVSLPGSTV